LLPSQSDAEVSSRFKGSVPFVERAFDVGFDLEATDGGLIVVHHAAGCFSL
jgi:hypothetical protein